MSSALPYGVPVGTLREDCGLLPWFFSCKSSNWSRCATSLSYGSRRWLSRLLCDRRGRALAQPWPVLTAQDWACGSAVLAEARNRACVYCVKIESFENRDYLYGQNDLWQRSQLFSRKHCHKIDDSQDWSVKISSGSERLKERLT